MIMNRNDASGIIIITGDQKCRYIRANDTMLKTAHKGVDDQSVMVRASLRARIPIYVNKHFNDKDTLLMLLQFDVSSLPLPFLEQSSNHKCTSSHRTWGNNASYSTIDHPEQQQQQQARMIIIEFNTFKDGFTVAIRTCTIY